MKLELKVHNISGARLSEKTAIDQGILSINRDELIQVLEADRRLSDIRVELANPGEGSRIVQVVDVIEPRAKIGDGSQDFPGAVGRQSPAGQGVTSVLRGAAVITSEYYNLDTWAKTDPIGSIIDMSGPGAEISPYGKTANIVIMPTPAKGIKLADYRVALKIAGLKAAVYLARAAVQLTPDETEIFEIPSLTEASGSQSALPRVVYIFQVYTNQFEPLPVEPILYGDNIDKIVPTILHPNEILDGAVTSPFSNYFQETYVIQNHPIVKELYRHHGKDLFFAGVIITNAPNNVPEFERTASISANLAKWVLNANGAILTKTGGGAPELVMASTAQKCEQLGIKTGIALLHMGIDATDISLKPSVIFNAPEIDAMVSMGAPMGLFTVPPMEKVIGYCAEPKAGGELRRPINSIKGSLSQLGNSRLFAVRY